MSEAVVKRVAPTARPAWSFISAEPEEVRNHIIRTVRPNKVARVSPTPEQRGRA